MVSTPQEMDREKFPQNHRVGKMEQQKCYGWDLRLLNELWRFYQKFIIFTVDKMGFKLESILCKQCELHWQLPTDELQISIMIF